MKPDELAYIRDVLQDVPGLHGEPEEILDTLASYVKLRRTKRGEWICREGEAGESLFVIGEGTADVIKESQSGRPFRVAELTPGVLFGHVAVVTEGLRTASVQARSEVVLLELPATAIRSLISEAELRVGSPVRRALIVALSRQLHSATATTMQLAVDAGISETNPMRDSDSMGFLGPVAGELPEDTEHRIARASSLL